MGSKKTTIGYTYYMGVHFGMCHGPVDALRAIRVGKRLAWSGNVTGNTPFMINVPNLFGGEKKEGGIVGTFTPMFGGASQGANSYLAAQQGAMQPGYRGLVTAVYDGQICSMSPYPKPWAFRLRRILAGWNTVVWRPDLARIEMDGGAIHGMNPAHIFYQTITDPEWGMGYPESSIDLAVLEAAAVRLYDEGMGLCLKWNKSDTVENWIQMLADHVGAIITTDRNTGKFRFDLLRDDYDFEDLPIFGPNNVIELMEYEPPSIENAINEITVTYHDPISNNDGALTLQSLAGVQTQGRVVAQKKEYKGFPTPELAARAAIRDLRSSSVGLKRVELRVNRDAYDLRPGQVIRFQWPADGIDIAMRVGEVNYGTLTSGEITLNAVEDIFGLPDNTYLKPQNPAWTPPITTATDMAIARVREAAYLDVARAFEPSEMQAVGEMEGFVLAYGPAPTSLAMNFGVFTRTGSNPYQEDGTGDMCAVGYLGSAIGVADTEITLEGLLMSERFVIGEMCDLDGELVQLEDWDAETGVATIVRGVGDTVPRPHLSGSIFYAYGDYCGYAMRPYLSGELVNVKLVTRTPSDELAEGMATTRSVTMNHRFDRPYPPAQFRLNGDHAPASVSDMISVTWAHRNRLTQQDQIVGSEAASIDREPTVRYSLRFRDASNNVLVEKLDIAGTYAEALLAYTGVVHLEFWSVSENGNSWQAHSRSFNYTPTGGVTESEIFAETYDPEDDATIIDGGDLDE